VFDPDSVDFAGHGVVGVAAAGSVLGWGLVAQRRVAVPVIVLVFEVTDHHAGFEQIRPVVAVETLLPQAVVERFDVAVVPRLSG
jgi:hypothetical protein